MKFPRFDCAYGPTRASSSASEVSGPYNDSARGPKNSVLAGTKRHHRDVPSVENFVEASKDPNTDPELAELFRAVGSLGSKADSVEALAIATATHIALALPMVSAEARRRVDNFSLSSTAPRRRAPLPPQLAKATVRKETLWSPDERSRSAYRNPRSISSRGVTTIANVPRKQEMATSSADDFGDDDRTRSDGAGDGSFNSVRGEESASKRSRGGGDWVLKVHNLLQSGSVLTWSEDGLKFG